MDSPQEPFWGACTFKNFTSQLIPAVIAGEFYRIHALADKVQAQASRPNIFERSPAHLFRIRRYSVVFQHDFKSISRLAIFRRINPVEGRIDGPIWVSKVSVANDIGQRFVNGAHDGAAIRLGESQFGGELSHCVSHHAEHLRIAPQFHSE